jgi:aminoglycoside phosphotransferase (APT) family kinase protein
MVRLVLDRAQQSEMNIPANSLENNSDLPVDRLTVWLNENVAGFRGPLQLKRFAGGQSNPTYKIEAASGDYVLRRKPIGNVLPTAHAVDREFRVLSAVGQAGVPVPRVHAICTDFAILGSLFYVMDFVPGRTFWDPRVPELSPEDRSRLFDSMNRVIAAIHDLDPESVGLADFGPQHSYLARQVSRWTKQYRAAEATVNDSMEKLIEWLPKNLPSEGELRVVHGDYRLDNVLVHPIEPRIVAVLDWERATLGNPIADFAYHAMTWRIPPLLFRGLAGVDFANLGIPDEPKYVAKYFERRNGKAPDNWDFYIVLSLFRIASILQGIAKRAADGTSANADANEVGSKARPLANLAWQWASRL